MPASCYTWSASCLSKVARVKAWLHDTALKMSISQEQLQAAMQLSLEEAGGAKTEACRGS